MRPNVFLLKIDLYALFLQIAHRGQAVHCIPGEAADGLGDDEVYHESGIDTKKAPNRRK